MAAAAVVPPAEALRKAKGRRLQGFGAEEHGGPPRPFRFVQMADTQLGMEVTFTKVTPSVWDKELALMRRAAAEVNRLRPAFAIVCGDLVDEFPTGDPDVKARQERDFKETCDLIDPEIPLLCVCGNHDIGNRPNSVTVGNYIKGFGEDYFSFWCHGVKCLVLNSQFWKDDTDSKELREAMEVWIDKELAEHASGPLLIFSHIAPFLFNPEEGDEYFNLPQAIRMPLLEKMAAHGGVGWFCGHYHRNAGGVYYHEESGKQLEVVVTAAVGTQILSKEGENPLGLAGMGEHEIGEHVSGLRVVNVLADGGLQHKWYTLAELRRQASEASEASEAAGVADAVADAVAGARVE